MGNKHKGSSVLSKWFRGKVCLVTGATSGIGREIARQLAFSGSTVLLCGRNEKAMDLLLEELDADSSAEGFLTDLSDRKSLEGLISKVNKNHDVDILVNKAGFGYMSDFYLTPKKVVC